jgi:hypothetical protein
VAITDYSSLQTSVLSWLGRASDTALAASVPDFIALGEQRIFYGSEDPQLPSEPIRVRQMEYSASATTTAGTAAVLLPSGWLAGRRLYIDGSPHKKLDFLTPAQFGDLYASSLTGTPRAYTIEGENFIFGPTPDSAYTVQAEFYKKPDPLATTSTNALLSAAPGLYLFAALIEACDFLGDDNGAVKFLRKYSGAANGLQSADSSDRHSGATLQIRTDTGNP